MVNSPHSRIVLAHCCEQATPSHLLAHSPARHDEKWNVALSLGTWTIGVAGNWFAMTLNPSFVMNKELDNAANDQHFSGDDAFFGYASVGAKASSPLPVNADFGSWSLTASANVLFLGDSAKAFNEDDTTDFVGTIGIAVTYSVVLSPSWQYMQHTASVVRRRGS